jgi:hypothetical protein
LLKHLQRAEEVGEEGLHAEQASAYGWLERKYHAPRQPTAPRAAEADAVQAKAPTPARRYRSRRPTASCKPPPAPDGAPEATARPWWVPQDVGTGRRDP